MIIQCHINTITQYEVLHTLTCRYKQLKREIYNVGVFVCDNIGCGEMRSADCNIKNYL